MAAYGLYLSCPPKWVALLLYEQITNTNEANWKILKNDVLKLLSKTNFFLHLQNQNSLDTYALFVVVNKVLNETVNNVFAKKIAQQIFVSSKTEEIYTIDYEFQEVIQTLIEKYFKITWNVFGPALIANGLEYFNLKSLLGSKNGSFTNSGLLFNDNTSDALIEWCRNTSPKGPNRIAYMMPTQNINKDGSLWHPFALKMIDNFFELPGFSDELGANLGSFGWVGSAVPYYEIIKEMMNELTTHKSVKVRKWAIAGVRHYEKQIKFEKLRDETK